MKQDSLHALTSALKVNGNTFHQVVPWTDQDKMLLMDFTASNSEWHPSLLCDTTLFTTHVNNKLNAAGARYGIGGYAEHRTIYSRSRVFDVSDEEPRRLHLGIDIWGRPYTAVMAPLDGIVHSFAFNNAYGDYGATIILSHRLEECTFYTLYGHLSLNSLSNLQEGQTIKKGDTFSQFGIPFENGQWPPHLHFQIILDMGGRSGDYPGVCKYSEREQWLLNSPDPDLILNMMNRAMKGVNES